MKKMELLKLLKKDKNVYCHITSNLDEDNYFYPRIPDISREDEDTSIDRVCVAETLEGAFTAIPNGAGRLDTYFEECSYYFKVFIIDIKKLGIKKIMSSKELYEKDYVRDAEITGEHWILEPFTVPEEDILYIRLDNWDESPEDLIPHQIYKLSETDEYDGDIEGAYYDVYKKDMPFIFSIRNVEVLPEEIKANVAVKIDLEFSESYLDKDELKEKFLSSNPDIEFVDNEDDENIIFLTKKDQNISKIIYTDWYYKHCI